MEELVEVENRTFGDQCIQFMLNEHSKMSDQSKPLFYVRWSEYGPHKRTEVQSRLRHLTKAGYVKVNPYIRPYDGEAVPGRLQVNILPAGMTLVNARITERTVTTTTTTTEKVTEPLPLEETYQEYEKKRLFSRTDRGNFILNACLESLISDVKSHIKAVVDLSCSGYAKDEGKFRGHQYWLRYWLGYRWKDFPEALRVEAEHYRDLEFTRRKSRID